MSSRVHTVAGVALVAAAIIVGTAGVSLAGQKDQTVLRGAVMVGVSAPYTGATNAIRGVNGGGAPWVIADAEFNLRASGRIEVTVASATVLDRKLCESP